MLTTGQSTGKEELRALIADTLDVPVERLTDDAHFVDELEVDSLLSLEVLVALEQNYGVKLSEDEFRTVTCFRNVYELMEHRRQAA